MPSPVQQNRTAIQLSIGSLARNRFRQVRSNRDQGTFPDAYITAARSNKSYLIGVTSREEIGADGEPNPSYSIVQTAIALEKARALADEDDRIPAFVAIVLRRREGTYSAFFDTLESIEFRRSIPMLPEDRASYELLVDNEYDSRVEDLGGTHG